MSHEIFDELDQFNSQQGAVEMIDSLTKRLLESKNYHQLFDALLVKAKESMNLPLLQPTSLTDVPPELQDKFQEQYVQAARTVGELFLEEQNIPEAWIYLRTIQEPEKVRAAIEAIPIPHESNEQSDQILEVALYEGAHPTKGFEWLLRTHGICNTVTAFEQSSQQMNNEDRRTVAKLLVNEIYNNLINGIQYSIEQRMAITTTSKDSLATLIAERDWLFEEGNYHVDVSHLNSIVRFAKFLQPDDTELPKAVELAEYGSHLEGDLQFPGETPFDDFYPAHRYYFMALLDDKRDEAINYFQQKLNDEPITEEKPTIAYVLVDLLLQCNLPDKALEVAKEHLQNSDNSVGITFADVCRETNNLAALGDYARQQNDPITYAATLIQQQKQIAETNDPS
ncbi:hypothetical protein MNBD_PLANCTO02-2821 [hydrothermal vent metagenome]|uniref:Uncharacterized protein n=1 Tax=hydrothermal vent metagenome TaxID=652676 RepID=A0A3B1D743_9ZZZZ